MTRDELVTSLLSGDRTRALSGPHLSKAFLDETVDFASLYAELEKLLFGGTRVAYSPSALGIDLGPSGDPVAQGEVLAQAERQRFGLDTGPILELSWLIEDQGVKILPRLFPEGSTVRGGFFFDSTLGPCIVVDANATTIQRDYAIVHQYGHFLADYDPYVPALCGHPSPETLADPRELRAHAFALAFLMPRVDLETYRAAYHLKPGDPISAEFARQLQVYFAVDFEIVFWRLLTLGWIDARQMETLLRDNPDLLGPVDVDRMDADERLAFLGTIPERYVHLVASAFGRGLIELDDAARFLETSLEEAKHVLEQFHYEDPSKDAPPPGAARVDRSGSNPHAN